LTDTAAKSISPRVPELPATMKAIVADGAGGLELVERPVPRPGAGEVLVKVAAAGVNRPDVLQRRGLYPPPPAAPDILGLEIAGQIVTTGSGGLHLPGEKVCALVAGGGYAEYCVAPAGTCLPIPRSLTAVDAAAMPETLFTVWVNLFERGFAADGDWVLVHGGTSGIGTMAIGLGQLFGLKVIVTCGTDAKCAAALKLGAAAAINYTTQDFVEEVHRVTDRRGVNVVVDMVGGDYVPRNLASLAEEGRHVSIAVQRGGQRGGADLRHHAAAADPDRIDAAAALDRVQDHGRRRDCADRLAVCRGRAPEAGDRQHLPPRRSRRSP
jgi:putative PIG3 family NAD(P)H quinone oxidoreductase